MKDTLKILCTAYGPTGNEYNVAEIIKGMVAPYVDEMKMDAMGNLITVKKGQEGGKKIMLAAHMDHIGFVVTDIDDKGFARVHNVGGIRKANSLYRRVVFENGVSGILAAENGDDANDRDMTKLFVDLGAANKEEAEKMIRRGDFAVYAPEFTELSNNLVAGTAMDDRAGCAIQIETLKRLGETKNEIVAVFTVQEEVGLRGATAAAFDVAPDMGIALDVTLCGDTPKGPKIAVKAGEGIAVKILDNSLICHPGVVKAMEEAAERAGAKYQREVLTAGGTDAGAIQRSRGGIPSGVLSIPCRYVHSPNEVVSLNDMEDGVKLLVELLKA
ncbi:MAG: M42 family metallopeptidase [Clostridia bacterium]|nr:M42 family metallopeptidase [Clostridia bacterium]